MKTSRRWVSVAILLLGGGILGFAVAVAATRPMAAVAEDAKTSHPGGAD